MLSSNQTKQSLSTYVGKVKKYFESKNKKGNFDQGFLNPAQRNYSGATGQNGETVACNCECHGKIRNQQKRKMQLKNGVPVPVSFSGNFTNASKNLVQTSRSSETLLSKPIYIYMLIGLFFFMYRPNVSPYSFEIILVPLIFYVALGVIKEYFINYHKFLIDREFLRGYQVKVLNKIGQVKQNQKNPYPSQPRKSSLQRDKEADNEFNVFRCCQVEPGDILFIKKDEFVPADVLILDASERYFDVNTQKINGQSSLQPKEALRVTFEDPNSQVKGKFEEYRKQLNCTVEYYQDTTVAEELEGTLRLKVEPTGEKFAINNILLNGTYLHRVDWVFGFVLKCGKESNIIQNTDFSYKKQNFFERIVQKFSTFLIIAIVLLSLLSKLLYAERQSNNKSLSEIEIYLSQNYWHGNSSIITDSRTFYMIFSVCLPMSIFALLDTLNKEKQIVRVNNPEALANLGVVSWTFFDKTGTITNNKLKIESIILDNELFFLDKQSEFYRQMLELEDQEEQLLAEQEIEMGIGIQPLAPTQGQQINGGTSNGKLPFPSNTDQGEPKLSIESGGQVNEIQPSQFNSQHYYRTGSDGFKNSKNIQSNPFLAKVANQINLLQNSLVVTGSPKNQIESSIFGLKSVQYQDAQKLILSRNATSSFRVNTFGDVQSPFVNQKQNSQEQRKRLESVFVKAPSRFASLKDQVNIPSIQSIVNHEVTSMSDTNKLDTIQPIIINNIHPIIEDSNNHYENDTDSIKQNFNFGQQFSPQFNELKNNLKVSLQLDTEQIKSEDNQSNKSSKSNNSEQNNKENKDNSSIYSNESEDLNEKYDKKKNDKFKDQDDNYNDNDENRDGFSGGMICNIFGKQDDSNDEENKYKHVFLTHQNKTNKSYQNSHDNSKQPKKHNTIIQEVEEAIEGGEDGQDDQNEQAVYGEKRHKSPKNSLLISNYQKSGSSANINSSNIIQSSPKFKQQTLNTQSFKDITECASHNVTNSKQENANNGILTYGSIKEKDEDDIKDNTVNITDEVDDLDLASENQNINKVFQWNYGNTKQEIRNISFTDFPNNINGINLFENFDKYKSPQLENQGSLQNVQPTTPQALVKEYTSLIQLNQQNNKNIIKFMSDQQLPTNEYIKNEQNKKQQNQQIQQYQSQQDQQQKQQSQFQQQQQQQQTYQLQQQQQKSGPQTFKKRLINRGASFDVNININKNKVRFQNGKNDEYTLRSPLKINNHNHDNYIKDNGDAQTQDVQNKFQILNHSKSSNQHDQLRNRFSPLSIQNKVNLFQDMGDLSPQSYKRANTQKLTRLNMQSTQSNSQNNSNNIMANITTSIIKNSQISEVGIQKITYHEGEDEFLQRVADYEDKTQDFVKALIVCQGWKIKIDKEKIIQMEGKKREDEYIYKYIKSLGIKCELRKKRNQYYIISNVKKKEAPKNKVIIRKSIDFQSYRNRSSFLVEESQEPSEKQKQMKQFLNTPTTYSLYVKGDQSVLDLCKDMNQMFKERLRFCINKQVDLGCRAIIYAKKNLSRKQVEEIESIIKTMKTTTEEFEGYYERLFYEIESDIHFLGIIFVQDIINEGFQENLQFLNDCQIKVGILSGDTQEKVKSVANLCKFTAPQYGLSQKIFEIEGFTQEEISISIKKCLASLKDLISLDSNNNNKNLMILHELNQNERNQQEQLISFTYDRKVFQNALIVGQKQLDVISNNQSLEAHFAFIISHVGKLIAYELRAEHKQYFVRLLKFIEKKTVVMSVGDGWNDALMMQISDISFELRSEDFTQKSENALSQLELKKLGSQKSSHYSPVKHQKSKLHKPSAFNGKIIEPLSFLLPKSQNQQTPEEQKKKIFTTFQYPNAGDVIIQDLSLIKLFMKFYAPRLIKQYQYIIFESFYFSFLLFLFNLSSNWENFSGNLQISNSDFVFLSIIIFIPRILCYIFFYDPMNHSYEFPLIQYFDKLYHNNKQQRQMLRVSSLFTNSLIESLFHFIFIYLTSITCNIDDSFENLRLFIVLQILIVTRFKMFYNKQIDLKYPKFALGCFLTYEFFASYLYFGVYLKYNKNIQRTEIDQAFTDGQNIMILIFNLISCTLFSYFFQELRTNINDSFLNKFLKQVDLMSGQIQKIVYALRRLESNHMIGEIQTQQQQNINRQGSMSQGLLGKERFDYLNILASLEQFLENQIIQMKKPYNLIKRIFKQVKIDKHIEQILNPAELSLSVGQGYKKTTLQFIDQSLEKSYETQASKLTLLNLRFNMVLKTFPSLIICIISFSINEPLRGEESYSSGVTQFRLISLILSIMFMIFSFALFREKFLPIMKQILIIFMSVAILYEIIFGYAKLIDFSSIAPFISYLMSLLPFTFVSSVFLSSFNLAQQYIWFSIHMKSYIKVDSEKYYKEGQSTLISLYLHLCYFIILFVCWLNSLLNKYIDERDKKNDFLLKIQFQEQKAQRQDILGILLPEFIREDVILVFRNPNYILKKGKSNFSRDQEEASILFCDISEFDKIMNSEDFKIVSLLDNLFREFDELTFQFGLQKIETVGKTYMAAGGLKAVEKNLSKKITRTPHFVRMLVMQNKMHQVAAKSQWGDGQPIKLKIGIHIGPITAGVIGYHKPQFSLIGDTVNTTSRLCANCDPEKSLFSDIVFEKITPFLQGNTTDIDWAYEEFQFEAKGKGILKAYYIAEYIENEIYKSQIEPQANHENDIQNNQSNHILVVSKQRTKRERLQTKIYDVKAHFSENEYDQIQESQQIQSPSEINSNGLPKSNSLFHGLQRKRSNYDNEPINSAEKKKIYKNSENKILSDEYKSIESPHAEQFNKSSNKAINSHNNSYINNIPPLSNNPSLHNILNISERKKFDDSNYNELSNMISPTHKKKNTNVNIQNIYIDKTEKINGILSQKSLAKPVSSAQSSVILENIAEKDSKLNSNQQIGTNRVFSSKIQNGEQKSANSIMMIDQQNPQEDDRYNHITNSIMKANEMIRSSKIKILDQKGILKRQESKISHKNDIMEKSVMNDIGKSIINQEQDETNPPSANDDTEVETIKYNWFLTLNNNTQKALFSNFEQLQFYKGYQVFILQLTILFILNFFMMTFRIIILSNGINWIFYSTDIISIVAIIITIFSWKKLCQDNQLRKVTLLLMFISTSSVLGEFYFSYNGVFKVIDMLHLQAISILGIINMCFRFTDAILFSSFLVIGFQTIDVFKGSFCMSDIFLLLIPISCFLFQKRQTCKRNLEFFNKNRSNDHQKYQEERLLYNLLPQHIFDTFLRNPEDNSIFTEKFTQTTLLFADISGFTAYSSNKKPEQVVHMLKSLFTKFDHKCIKHNVFKLYTIGDCYIVMGFSDANKRDPPTEAKNVLEMGFSMIESLRQFRIEQKDPSDQNADIHMRIGIHIGDIIGGVIGKNVVRYDIYGKDVLLANKMESNGDRGRILISDPLKQVLQEHFPDKYEYKSGPEVQVKSINISMKSFFVDQQQKQD